MDLIIWFNWFSWTDSINDSDSSCLLQDFLLRWSHELKPNKVFGEQATYQIDFSSNAHSEFATVWIPPCAIHTIHTVPHTERNLVFAISRWVTHPTVGFQRLSLCGILSALIDRLNLFFGKQAISLFNRWSGFSNSPMQNGSRRVRWTERG